MSRGPRIAAIGIDSRFVITGRCTRIVRSPLNVVNRCVGVGTDHRIGRDSRYFNLFDHTFLHVWLMYG